ncbi:MAG: alanine--tRNA ligase [Mageeibacillus sp.]|jgi:alanyl-tRNA synthetase|nr:alanine--tRNA ligase [Mageeibacillus sp.]
MEPLGLNEIRERYLSFFESKGHLRLPSFSLVPRNDPSILLINAGMTPMKPYFTGAEVPPRKRVTTCQKCIRTPDIENVGHTSRHGTYFEMLGNFSFGDYFKDEVIPWAWEFLTKTLEMPEDKLWPSVYEEDDEAFAIWRDVIGLPENRITRLGKADNFWEHGTGPCGPCSEIYFDRGERYGCGKPTCRPGCECDRFVEIWNLVFSQFDRQEDGTYLPLKQKNIDTGAGLERVACVMQGVDNLFEVDTVRKILDTVCEISGKTYGVNHDDDVAIRVITDHMRSSTMMISDGVLPSNEGRGYVLRRLMRRAARFGRLLGIEDSFLVRIAEVVVDRNKDAYPELITRKDYIMKIIAQEEQAFGRTVAAGTEILNQMIAGCKSSGITVLAGEDAFKLHDTYGFPLDLTKEIATDNGLTVDEDGFKAAMKHQKDTARAATKAINDTAWGGTELPAEVVADKNATTFVGYSELGCDAKLIHIIKADEEGNLYPEEEAFENDEIIAVFDKTSLYATMGGQVHDNGVITGDGFEASVISVDKDNSGKFLHKLLITRGAVRQGAQVRINTDAAMRMAIARNHTATHILQSALKSVLGNHVEQAGSLVADDRLRFDFNHFQAMTKEEIAKVEAIVNDVVLQDIPVITREMAISDAQKLGATALFGEKYGSVVRVVSVGDFDNPFDMEFCGGTHLKSSGQIGQFRIVSEAGIAAGTRRIEAVTGAKCYEMSKADRDLIDEACGALKSGREQIVERINALHGELKSLEKEIADIEKAKAGSFAENAAAKAIEIGGIKAVISTCDASDASALRDTADKIRDNIGNGVVFLASCSEGKVLFTAMATKSAVDCGAHCGNIIREAAKIAGGGGGGRPDMAQAGGKDASRIPEALAKAEEVLRSQIK